MIDLEQKMICSVKTTNAMEPTAGLPRAVIQYWQVSKASWPASAFAPSLLRPARLDASRCGWFSRPDIRTQFITDDGVILPMHYTGLVEQTERFKAAAESDRPTEWTSNTCGFPSHSIAAMRATAG
jgi:hypothetical protein